MNAKKIKLVLIIIISVFFICLSAFALYMYNNSDIHLQKAKDFYFDSDYLSAETVPTYYIYGGGQQSFTFELRNFEDSLRFTSDTITYNVETEGFDSIVIDNVTGSIEGGSKNQDKITVTIPEGYTDGVEILIKAQSVPYEKILCAKLKLYTSTSLGKYYIEDSAGQSYAKLIICANTEFTPTINWINAIEIDCTNPYVMNNDGIVSPDVETNTMQLNKPVKKGESISINFFKSDLSSDYSKTETGINTAGTLILVGN